MDEIVVDDVASPNLDEPILLEGLPGVAHVGALAANHLVEECDATLVRRVYSEHFPPQVMIDETSAVLTGSEVHAVDLDGTDALVLTGDHQPQTAAGHYRITDAYLDIAEAFGVERIIAMGGVPTGELIDEYDVLAAATDATFVSDLETAGATFREDEPAGGIVGVSGLLLGLGARRGFQAACLMGETSGYLVDPKSATGLLEVLQALLEFDLDMSSLDERAAEIEDVINQIREFETQSQLPSDEDLRYIG